MKLSAKIIGIILIIALLGGLMMGCARKGKCEDCGQYEILNKFVDRNGNVHYYCDDCYRLEKLFS